MTTKKYVALVGIIIFSIIQVQAQKKKDTKVPKTAIEQPSKEGFGVIQFDYLKFNFGNINEKGGRVYHDFHFVNLGSGPLTIKNVVTSCGCTNTTYTRTTIQPGDSGVVIASYDPDGRQGEFDKTILVETDGNPSNQTLTIKGHVYASKFNFTDTYKYQYGNVAVITNAITFNNVKTTGYDSSEIGLYNMSNKRIYVYKIEAPANIEAIKPYDNMPPNTDMRIKLKYYPKNPPDYGMSKSEIRIYTNDDSLPVKKFYVTANVKEDFSQLTKSDLKKAPKMVLSSTEIDLGNVPLFNSPSGTFTITNKGKQDLIIRRIVRTCSCLNPELSQTIIPKGKSATLKVAFSLVNMAGPDSKTIKIITNDPKQSEVTLTLKINVTE
ncbi:MAG: hypothetical protein CFE21_06955 [Bacteroidetes bacterium B1(2017)]|nr:MAG: hypothetical protein CFE21_06955 [Bacteroidetes bacterium B1(2017)]